MPRDFDPTRARIREVLLRDWDPHDAARSEAAQGVYDSYVEPLYVLLRSAAGEDAIVEYLHDRERESMCFPSLGTRRLRPVARRLLAIPTGPGDGGDVDDLEPVT